MSHVDMHKACTFYIRCLNLLSIKLLKGIVLLLPKEDKNQLFPFKQNTKHRSSYSWMFVVYTLVFTVFSQSLRLLVNQKSDGQTQKIFGQNNHKRTGSRKKNPACRISLNLSNCVDNITALYTD